MQQAVDENPDAAAKVRNGKLSDKQLLQRAPREVVEKERAIHSELLEKQAKLLERLKRLE